MHDLVLLPTSALFAQVFSLLAHKVGDVVGGISYHGVIYLVQLHWQQEQTLRMLKQRNNDRPFDGHSFRAFYINFSEKKFNRV
jgi:hypothetical protein